VKRRTKQEQKLADDVCLLRWWKAWHREQLEEALSGVHRDVLERVMAQLKNLKSARELGRCGYAPDRTARDQCRDRQAAIELGPAADQ